MWRHVVVAALAMVIVSCGPQSAATVARKLTTPTPAAWRLPPASAWVSPLPAGSAAPTTTRKCGFTSLASTSSQPSRLPPADAYALAVVYSNGFETVHLLTVQGTAVADKVLLDNADALVMDVGLGVAIVAAAHGTELATLDLHSGALRTVGGSDGCGVGPGVLSPDSTKVALATRNADLSYELMIVDLASGAGRPLLRTAIDEYNRAGLVPLEWLPSGILVTPGVWDGPHSRLLNLDPATGALTPLTDAQVDRLSSDGRLVAAAQHADLGDGPFNGQGLWPNRLTVGPVAASPTVVAMQKQRAFTALDLENDGTLLYTKDDAPLSTAQPAPDTGLYLYRNGASYQQFGEEVVIEWESAAIVGQNLALVGRQTAPGASGAVEFDLATLCAASGCHATSRPVLTVTGTYPGAFLLSVRQ